MHHNIIEHTHAKLLASTLEHQVSYCDTNSEVLIVSVTQHTPHNRVNDMITHVTLNTIHVVAL
jgi:hypothetical protein